MSRKVEITREQFVGAQMANLLHFLSRNLYVAGEYRLKAKQLAERWDSISSLRLNNPIVSAELEGRLFPPVEPPQAPEPEPIFKSLDELKKKDITRLRKLVHKGQPIDAIKLLRGWMDISLLDAKNYIDSLRK